MNDIDRIDKEASLIKLTIGQICSAGIAHNIYTGDRKTYALPFMHTVSERKELPLGYGNRPYTTYESKDVGHVIRISNDGTIISNPSYRGNAIIAFIPKGFENTKIHTCKITRINKRSVNIEPIEYEKGDSLK
jgi:hypothetical protein